MTTSMGIVVTNEFWSHRSPPSGTSLLHHKQEGDYVCDASSCVDHLNQAVRSKMLMNKNTLVELLLPVYMLNKLNNLYWHSFHFRRSIPSWSILPIHMFILGAFILEHHAWSIHSIMFRSHKFTSKNDNTTIKTEVEGCGEEGCAEVRRLLLPANLTLTGYPN
jgi:hypothetical protein